MISVLRRSALLRNFILVSLALMLGLNWINSPGVPVKILSAEISPATAKAGDLVYAAFTVNRTQICPNTIDSYWAMASSPNTPVARLPPRSRVEPKIGKFIPVSINLVAPAVLGEVCYHSRVHHRCSDGQYTVVTPPLCITVTP